MQNISGLSTVMFSPTLYVLIQYHISAALISTHERLCWWKTWSWDL